jgi:hypothetical protein
MHQQHGEQFGIAGIATIAYDNIECQYTVKPHRPTRPPRIAIPAKD